MEMGAAAITARRPWPEPFQPIVSRLPPAALDRYPRGFSGHVAVPNRSIQRAATAFAASFLLHSLRSAFISARNEAMRGPTPLYFFVIPVTVRLTAPWPTRPW